MTLEAWVNPSTVNANWRDVIYKGNDNYYLEATSTNASKPDAGLIAGGTYADVYGTAALPANTWSYLAETYDGSTVRLYVNGTQVGSVAHTGAITTSTNQLQIGGDSLYGQYFAGMIDEVRIYNTALTAAQIQADQTTPVNPTGPTRRRRRSRARCRRRRSRPARSTCPGVRSSDNVGVTGYLVERCGGAACSQLRADRAPPAPATTLQGHHRQPSPPPTATASARPTPPATSAATPTPPPPPRRRRRIRLVGRCRGCRGRWCCRTTVATI